RPAINWLNLVFLLGTLLIALVGTPWYIVKFGLGWPEAVTFLVLWLFVGISVTAGYHRLFSHKTYQAAWPVRLFFVVFGAGALENSVLNWSADHRVHHAHVDEERDPYNITKGFWWAHMGWIFFENEDIPASVVRDLSEDPLVRWQARYYAWIGLGVAMGIPLVVGLLTGHLLGCLLIGGVLRIVVSHHGTFFINSLCHMVGHRPYSTEHSARDSAVMAVLAFGEGYHNYHHSFPFDYRNGVKVWQFDPAKWTIWTLSRVGLARDLRRAPEAAVLKAKIEVQFEHAKERLQQVVHDFREHHEARLHEAYASLQTALHELISLQRRQKPKAAVAGEEEMPHETRLGLTYRALEEAMQEWKRTLRQTKRLTAAA
ncbi:MAG TPA: fatty acid desaturase, partial [Thermoanaerobaculia bacterium]|nr:fatty acid desaturase [Thermoanaerobaculia bacterium]